MSEASSWRTRRAGLCRVGLLDAARAVLVALGTPLLLFPFAWAGWVSVTLGLFHRLKLPSFVLRGSQEWSLHTHRGHLWVTPRGRQLPRRRRVLSGWLEPGGGDVVVVLELEGNLRQVVEMYSDADAKALLSAVGVGPEQQVLRVPLGSLAVLSGQGSVFHLLGPVLWGLMATGPMLACWQTARQIARSGQGYRELLATLGGLLAVAAIGVGLAWLLVPGEATVGRDGVMLRRLWNRRFFPFEQIRSVALGPYGVNLETTSQGTIQLPTSTFFADDSGPRMALDRRIRDAMDAWAASAHGEGVSLDRQGLPVEAWRRSLAGVLRGGYRSQGFELGDLLRVLEAPSASLEQRVGAALALGSSPLEPEARLRVDSAIRSSAHEPARVALQRAVDGDLDDALLDEALAADERVRRAGRATESR